MLIQDYHNTTIKITHSNKFNQISSNRVLEQRVNNNIIIQK